MSRRCEAFQQQIMEQWDRVGHVDDPSLQAHLKGCEACRMWIQFLHAESDAWTTVLSPPVDDYEWARALTRPVRRRMVFQWSLPVVGLVAAGLFMAIFLPRIQRYKTAVDTDLINAVVELDAITQLDTESGPPEYLERTGLVWTSEDLAILSESEEQKPASKSMENRSPTSSSGTRDRFKSWLV